MTAFYNEIDPYAAQWLRNLIAAGHIAPGVVDERSIEDIFPEELDEFTQCHFFAGIGIWSYALRLAGWPDERRVWTGSCPCQPFSAAGKGAGFGDERHLWPAWCHIISQCRPAVVFGEQVASKDAGTWLDLVQDDMEALGYAFGAVPFPAASVGAPHIRDRLYWVGHTDDDGSWRHARGFPGAQGEAERQMRRELDRVESSGAAGFMADAMRAGRPQGRAVAGIRPPAGRDAGTLGHERAAAERAGAPCRLADDDDDDDDDGRSGESSLRLRGSAFHDADGRGPLGGFWATADWIACRDGKWRPVESGTFPLAHGASSRVGRLRAYGNAIVAEAARVFIEEFMRAV